MVGEYVTHWNCPEARRTWNPMHRLTSAIERNRHATAVWQRGLHLHIRSRFHRAECCTECALLAQHIPGLITFAEQRLNRSYEQKGEPECKSN